MDKRNWYYSQIVTEAELDAAFDDVETMQQEQLVELGLYGVVHNPWSAAETLIIEQATPINMTVKCSKGIGYTKQGKRAKRTTDTDNINCAVDVSGNPTLPSPGNERYITIFILQDYEESDQRRDGNDQYVNFVLTESHKFEVIMGAVATPGNAVKPAERDDALILADILLDDAVVQISGYGTAIGQIDWSRKQTWDKVSDSYRAKELHASEKLYVNTNVPAPSHAAGQGHYAQAFVKAWGNVSAAGVVANKYNVSSVSRTSQGYYQVVLYSNTFNNLIDYVVQVQIWHAPPSLGGAVRLAQCVKQDEYRFIIYTMDTAGTLEDVDFTFIVCGQPLIS